MYLIKKWWLISIFIIAILIILFIAINGYHIFRLIANQEDLTIKFYIENIVFFALLGILLLLLLLSYTISKSRTIYRELDKIGEVARLSSQPLQHYLERLGILGAKISVINHHLDELNVKKTLKISALTNLNKFLVGRLAPRVIILDNEGKILNASQSVADYLISINAEWQGALVSQFFPDLDVYALLNNLRHTKSVTVRLQYQAGQDAESSAVIIFYPITDSQNGLAYCVGIWQEDIENHNTNNRK